MTDQLTAYEEKLIGKKVLNLVLPLRGTRADFMRWHEEMDKLLTHVKTVCTIEGTRWPMFRVIQDIKYHGEHTQREVHRYYESVGIYWRQRKKALACPQCDGYGDEGRCAYPEQAGLRRGDECYYRRVVPLMREG